MKREIFCMDCGLFYIGEQYITDEQGLIQYNSGIWNCPNKECSSHDVCTEEQRGRMSTDSTGFAYFSHGNKKFIKEFGWASPKYAPSDAIERYKENGLTIRSGGDED